MDINYFNDLIDSYKNNELPKKLKMAGIFFNAGNIESMDCSIIKCNYKNSDKSTLRIYISEQKSGRWISIKYCYLISDDNIFVIDEDSEEEFEIKFNEDVFNLSMQYELLFDLDTLHYIQTKFKELKNYIHSKEVVFYYGKNEEKLYGY